MLYAIHCLDNADATDKRGAHYPAHFAFLAEAAAHGARIVMSGPLIDETTSAPIGSLLIVEADSLATAEAFNKADPFYAADVWRSINVSAFKKTIG